MGMTDEMALLNLTLMAHTQAAKENTGNVSSHVLQQAAHAGKEFPESMAAAILTLGMVHAPITQARGVLFSMENDAIREALWDGARLPGFGNSFHKDGVDPAWQPVDEFLEQTFPEIHERIWDVSDIISNVKSKKVYPNAAAYTAAAAHLTKQPFGTEHAILLMGRVPAWVEQWKAASTL